MRVQCGGRSTGEAIGAGGVAGLATRADLDSSSGDRSVEFASFAEAWGELESCGVVPVDPEVVTPPPPPGVLASLELTLRETARRIHLLPSGGVGDVAGEERLDCPIDRIAPSLDHLLHKMHLAPLAVMPRCRWRSVLDAVCFTLAEDRAWQEVESETTLILNTRDALVAGPADLNTVNALVAALVGDGGAAEESIAIVPLSGQLLVEVVPGSGARIDVATEAIGDAVRELLVDASTRGD